MGITAAQSNYVCGYDKSLQKLQSGRNLETYGQFVKPYLKPGMSVLDCVCGLGSMTVDFAKAVSPGEVIGIDISEDTLKRAAENAKQQGIENIHFQLADVFNLPFHDESFDVVYAQTLLAHLPNPLDAIGEMKRVTKPGGIVAVKESYLSSWFAFPENEILREFLSFRMAPVVEQGGDLDIGIKLAILFENIGFQKVSFKMSCFNHDVATMAKMLANDMLDSAHSKKMLQSGEVDQDTLQRYKQAWLDFADIPGACNGMLYGEAIGVKA